MHSLHGQKARVQHSHPPSSAPFNNHELHPATMLRDAVLRASVLRAHARVCPILFHILSSACTHLWFFRPSISRSETDKDWHCGMTLSAVEERSPFLRRCTLRGSPCPDAEVIVRAARTCDAMPGTDEACGHAVPGADLACGHGHSHAAVTHLKDVSDSLRDLLVAQHPDVSTWHPLRVSIQHPDRSLMALHDNEGSLRSGDAS